jgi:hypothetical protein
MQPNRGKYSAGVINEGPQSAGRSLSATTKGLGLGLPTRSPSMLTVRRPETGHFARASRGLSFGLIHPRPGPFTGVRGRLPELVTDAGGRW